MGRRASGNARSRIALVAALRGDADVKPRLEHLQDGLNLHHGRSDFDASVPVFQEFPRQFGVKLGKRENGLFRFDFGAGRLKDGAAGLKCLVAFAP
jgi:hypothetical protein